jgi:arylsulfatase A-like enzyme
LVSVLREHGYVAGLAGKNHTFDDAARDERFQSVEEYSHWGKTHGQILALDREVAAYLHDERRPTFAHTSFAGSSLLGEGLIEGPLPFPAAQCPSARITDDAIAFTRKQRQQPFFLYYSFPDPHWPNVAPEPYYSRCAGVRLPPLEAEHVDFADRPFRHFVQSRAAGFDRYTASERRRILATYFGQVAFIDDSVGRYLAALDELGLAQDTIVVFTADHGNFAGRYGLVGKTGAFYDCLMRTPLIVRGPGVGSGRLPAMVESIDIAPTLLDLAGVPVPGTMRGRSLLPVLRGRRDHRSEVFAEVGSPCEALPRIPPGEFEERSAALHTEHGWFWFVDYTTRGRAAMLKDEHYKYCYYAGGEEELYHHAADPLEVHNRAADPVLLPHKERLRRRLMDRLLTEPLAH